jgi:hypothetical protein
LENKGGGTLRNRQTKPDEGLVEILTWKVALNWERLNYLRLPIKVFYIKVYPSINLIIFIFNITILSHQRIISAQEQIISLIWNKVTLYMFL